MNFTDIEDKAIKDKMEDDLIVRAAFDALHGVLSELELTELNPIEASGIIKALGEIDGVLRVIFYREETINSCCSSKTYNSILRHN